jgi:polyhydroxyalkanoate synthesis regulator phasin
MMTSGGMPMRPGLDAIYEALRRAIRDDPQLLERKAEQVSKELVRGGYLHDEPAVALVAEVLSDVEAGERRPQPQRPRPAAPDE